LLAMLSSPELPPKQECPAGGGPLCFELSTVGFRRSFSYQASLRANWNCRASYEAVGCPALQVAPALGSQSWLTAATFVRLKRLNESAMRSSLNRSPSGMRLDTRKSHWKKLGIVKRFRPRLPSQPAGAGSTPVDGKGEPSFARQTLAGPKVTPGMYFSEVVPVPLATMEGRAWEAPRSRRVSWPVMTLNGRPEENSIIGETVKPSMKYFAK